MSDSRSRNNGHLVATWEEMEREANTLQHVHSPDGDYIHASNFPFKPKRARRSHKVTVTTQDNLSPRDVNAGRDPEDIVPSALEESPLRIAERLQPIQKKQQHGFFDDMDSNESDDIMAEIDYAEAMRDVQRDSRSTNHAPGSPTKQRYPG